ncbi:hypothetical protein [Kribbella aluminosa]
MPKTVDQSSAAGGAAAGRLSVNLAADTMKMLRWLAGHRGLSLAETIRRAISILKFIEVEQAKGNTLAIAATDPEGKQRLKEILLIG